MVNMPQEGKRYDANLQVWNHNTHSISQKLVMTIVNLLQMFVLSSTLLKLLYVELKVYKMLT